MSATATLGGQFLQVVLLVVGIVAILIYIRITTQHAAQVFLTQATAAQAATVLHVETITHLFDRQRRLIADVVDSLRFVGAGAYVRPPPSVLVIDDDVLQLEVAERRLSKMGYSVRRATTGEAAIQSLTEDGMPDVIVLDLRLPAMDGLEFTRQIRWAGSLTPIVAYSGHVDAATRRQALDVGCNAVVAKGTNDSLVDQVGQWIGIAASVARQRAPRPPA